MDILVLLGTVVTSTVASALSILQPPIEATELRPLVVETIVEERIPPSPSLSPTPSIEPEATTAAETIVRVELHESMQSIPSTGTDGETAQLVSTAIPTHAPSPTATPSPSPTATPTVTTTPIQSGPTIKQAAPTTTAVPSPTSTPTVTITSPPPSVSTASLISTTPVPPPSASLNSDTILSLINAHRATKSLPAMEKEDRLCVLALSRGPELYNEIFVTKNVHAGFYSRKLPYWITENMAHYGSEETIVKWWLGSTIHRKAIEGDYKYSCGTCHGNSCAQLFTNYTPK